MRRRERLGVVGGFLVCTATLTLGGGSGGTYAAFSDFATVPTKAGAGVWTSDSTIAAECGNVNSYKNIVTGTGGDDVLDAGNGKQIVLGLGGDDTIAGGNGKDCLIGGAGDDELDGANGKDIMLGGAGVDTCRGGRAPDVYSCELPAEAARSGASSAESGPSDAADEGQPNQDEANDQDGKTPADATPPADKSPTESAPAAEVEHDVADAPVPPSAVAPDEPVEDGGVPDQIVDGATAAGTSVHPESPQASSPGTQ